MPVHELRELPAGICGKQRQQRLLEVENVLGRPDCHGSIEAVQSEEPRPGKLASVQLELTTAHDGLIRPENSGGCATVVNLDLTAPEADLGQFPLADFDNHCGGTGGYGAILHLQ